LAVTWPAVPPPVSTTLPIILFSSSINAAYESLNNRHTAADLIGSFVSDFPAVYFRLTDFDLTVL